MELQQISHREFLQIDRNFEKAARIVSLVYVNDGQPGIARVRKGRGFAYISDGKAVRDKKEILRIRKLAIPPAWTRVWICRLPDGHIQATGFDVRSRKQYRYHSLWSVLRNETKFHRLYEFGKALPALRLRLEEDMQRKELCEEKVIATVIMLMERTYIRVGNADYEKANGSYGLTTLKDKHVEIKGDKISFSFTGKKGIYHQISLKNKNLARMVKACRDIPGKELFQYYDESGNRNPIDSGMVNAYIKNATGADFSTKDFRTWAGSLNMLRALKAISQSHTGSDLKKHIVDALDEVSRKLGNTRTVCKKYYVHPGLLKLYEEDHLQEYLKQLDDIENPDGSTDWASDEKVLLKILDSQK